MLCALVKGPSYEEAKNQISETVAFADLVEFRIDLFSFFDREKIKELKDFCSLPVIFTFKSNVEHKDQRWSKCEALAQLYPAYIDLDWQEPLSFFEKIQAEYPEIQCICSFHDFEKTPDLEGTLSLLKNKPAHIYKLATTATNSLDALRMMNFVLTQTKNRNLLVGLCMGEHGQATRITASLIGSLWTYAPLNLDTATAPGQVDLFTLINLYRYKKLNKDTKIVALIGDPIDKSVGDLTHNYTFKKLGLNALYLKICVKKEELALFFSLTKSLPFIGFSITMPLKEAVLSLLDFVQEGHTAINTIAIKESKLFGYNTDGIGAIQVIEQYVSLKNRNLAILGAGGSAKAILCEARKKNAKIALFNRNPKRASCLVQGEECAYSLSEFPKKNPFEILINCTSCGMGDAHAMPLPDSTHFSKNQIVFDIISNPKETMLLRKAKEQGALTINGLEMFLAQGAAQYNYWFNQSFDSKQITGYFREALNEM